MALRKSDQDVVIAQAALHSVDPESAPGRIWQPTQHIAVHGVDKILIPGSRAIKGLEFIRPDKLIGEEILLVQPRLVGVEIVENAGPVAQPFLVGCAAIACLVHAIGKTEIGAVDVVKQVAVVEAQALDAVVPVGFATRLVDGHAATVDPVGNEIRANAVIGDGIVAGQPEEDIAAVAGLEQIVVQSAEDQIVVRIEQVPGDRAVDMIEQPGSCAERQHVDNLLSQRLFEARHESRFFFLRFLPHRDVDARMVEQIAVGILQCDFDRQQVAIPLSCGRSKSKSCLACSERPSSPT